MGQNEVQRWGTESKGHMAALMGGAEMAGARRAAVGPQTQPVHGFRCLSDGLLEGSVTQRGLAGVRQPSCSHTPGWRAVISAVAEGRWALQLPWQPRVGGEVLQTGEGPGGGLKGWAPWNAFQGNELEQTKGRLSRRCCNTESFWGHVFLLSDPTEQRASLLAASRTPWCPVLLFWKNFLLSVI